MRPTVGRRLAEAVSHDLTRFPAVALLGPRQVGKTTLARALVRKHEDEGGTAVVLDLERPSDLARLTDPEAFLGRHAADLVCIDEVQRAPDLFPVLRAVIDDDRRSGRFLLLGSASPALLRQSSESLVGRLATHELTPFVWSEVVPPHSYESLWLRGGYAESLLAEDDDASLHWREQYIRTFLERDVPQLGFRIPALTLDRFWRMCAHLHGDLLNLSALGRALGTSHVAARHHVDVLESTYVLRSLPPLAANLGKRLVKSPKLFVRDSGLLHALLGIGTLDDLSGHPSFGASWEGFVIEQVLSHHPRWRGSFYRTAKGAEIDLVVEKGPRRVAIECKASSAPSVTRGFYEALGDLGIEEAYVVAPVSRPFPLREGVEVVPVGVLVERLS